MHPTVRLLAACALVAAAASVTQAQVVATNFGPGSSYQTGTGNAWATGHGVTNAGVGSENAVSFVYGLADARLLDNFRFAAHWFNLGENELHVQFYEGADLNAATLLESFTFTAPTPFDDHVFMATSLARPLLQPGQTYWIVHTVDDLLGTGWGWQRNDQGALGYHARFTDFNSVPPTVGTWVPTNGETPVFDVTVAAAPAAVPEPATLGLVALGGLALALTRRRRA